MKWLDRHSAALQALGAMITGIVAIAALVGVKLQLDAADRVQSLQSARDAYRGHLVLAANLPKYAEPVDGCALLTSTEAASYEAFVDHLMYAAEQMLEAAEGWEETFLSELGPHQDYMCSVDGPVGDTERTEQLLSRFRLEQCTQEPSC